MFYNSAVYVLFDLPDFILLSTYTLLGLLWGEMNLRSRKHWLSLADSRHPWIVTYVGSLATLPPVARCGSVLAACLTNARSRGGQ